MGVGIKSFWLKAIFYTSYVRKATRQKMHTIPVWRILPTSSLLVRYTPLSEVMLVKSLFRCPSNRWRSRDLENKIPRSSEVYMVPKKVSEIKRKGEKSTNVSHKITTHFNFSYVKS